MGKTSSTWKHSILWQIETWLCSSYIPMPAHKSPITNTVSEYWSNGTISTITSNFIMSGKNIFMSSKSRCQRQAASTMLLPYAANLEPGPRYTGGEDLWTWDPPFLHFQSVLSWWGNGNCFISGVFSSFIYSFSHLFMHSFFHSLNNTLHVNLRILCAYEWVERGIRNFLF